MKFYIALFVLLFSFGISMTSENPNQSDTLPFMSKREFKQFDNHVNVSWNVVAHNCAQLITPFVLTSERLEEAIWMANSRQRLSDLQDFIADNSELFVKENKHK